MNIRIGGVYNSDIIHSLKKLNLSHFKFDLRPRSLNFTQITKVEELFKNHIESGDHISLCFEDENELTIEETIKRIKGDLTFKDIYLEFYSATRSIDFYDHFNELYYLHISSNFDLSTLNQYKNLKSVVIHSKDLEQLINFNQAHVFFTKLFKNLKPSQTVEIQLTWEDDLNASILSFYNIESLSFDIDSKVERSYRNIDQTLMNNIIGQNQKYIGEIVENTVNK